ncbi:MAG TPA: DUF1501 domain-containing protein [Thermoanaerobaculia bacterium]|nr:DUF1501 domain-containing protein [Thermoanaerobaculia bacterium]
MLVVLQLCGGNDALNTFIPYTDRRYRDARPVLAIADDRIIKISDRIGLHPSMEPMKDLYERGKFAFINNVGFPTLDRSHFRCRDVWQTGDESTGAGTQGGRGWAARYAELYLDTATSVTTFAVGPRSPLGLASRLVSGTTITSPDVFEASTHLVLDPAVSPDHASYREALLGIYQQPRVTSDLELIRARGSSAFESIELFKRLGPASMTPYPDTYLGRTFQLVARIAAAGIGTSIVWVTIDGFDTHGKQAQMHSRLLADVSSTLAGFQDDLAGRRLSDSVVVLAWSEFGRRVYENGALGTDHGKAGTVFLVGDRVKGGTFYGDVPDLADLDDGDLKTTIDFRSVYWTLIQDWFGRDPLPVLQRNYENVGFMRKPARPRAVRQ